MRKNNITLSFKNITSFLKILISHFTGKEKIITLCLIILMLSFVNTTLCLSNNSISALSYQSEVGIGFTFNPTLSVNLSSSDLIISNLTPGSSSDSNSINVSVATNASYGYTLSVSASSEDLVHNNNVNTFSGIAADANLESLTADNTWGYSTSLDNGTTWSNYNGLSTSSSTTLLDKDNNASSSVDFKIGAKAGSTQASGTYTNTITFTAVTKPTPMTLAEAYASEGKTMVNGFYTMQDMTSTICNKTEAIDAQLQVLDIRGYKVYWIAKLADNHCWMTQNLDLDLYNDVPLTSENTDLNDSAGAVYQNGYTMNNNIIKWTPATSANTIEFDGVNLESWQNSDIYPYSASKIDDENIGHASLGNHYNWTAAIASNDSSALISNTLNDVLRNPQNSICPIGWRLPTISNESKTVSGSTNEFARLNYLYNNDRTDTDTGLLISPLYFVYSGAVYSNSLIEVNERGYSTSSTVASSSKSYRFNFGSIGGVYVSDGTWAVRGGGISVRCLAR